MIRVIYLIFFLCIFSPIDNLFSQLINDSIQENNKSLTSQPDNLDIKLFRSINNLRNPFLDRIIYHTDIVCIPLCLSTPIIMFTTSKLNNNYYDESSAALLTLSEFSTIATTFIIKDLVKRERPFKKLKNVKHLKEDEKFIDEYSFPSGHTSLSFCFSTSLALRYTDKPLLITGLFAYSTIVAFGRIYLGVHYPSDVLAGMIIGTGSAFVIHSLRKELIGNYDKNTNKGISSDKMSTANVFLSFFITEGLNYILYKKNIKAYSQFIYSDNSKLFNLSFSF